MIQKAGIQLVAEDANAFIKAMNNAARAQDNFHEKLYKTGDIIPVNRDQAGFFSNIWVGAAETVGGAIVDAFMRAGQAVAGFIMQAPMMSAELEDKMNWFASISGGTDEELKRMKELVIILGKELPVSTMETADAAVELAKGGLSIATLEAGALRDTLNFAAASQMNLVQASEVVVKQMGTFTSTMATAEEQADFMRMSMDLMTKAANTSTLDVAGLSLGLQEAGGTAKAVGMDYEEFVTTMGLISPAFSSASTAGTSFKNFLIRLNPSSKEAYEEMKKLGLVIDDAGKMMEYLQTMGVQPLGQDVGTLSKQIRELLREDLGFKDTEIEKVFRELSQNNFYDTEGKLKSIAEISQILQNATKDLTNEERLYTMNKIFQSEAMNSAIQLANGGAVAYENFAEKMKFANGVSAQAADVQQGLEFEMNQFQGSIEALQLVVGDIFIPIMTEAYNALNRITGVGIEVAQAILGNNDSFEKLSPTMQTVVKHGKEIAKVIGHMYNVFFGRDLVVQTESFFALDQNMQNVVHTVRAIINWFSTLPQYADDVSSAFQWIVTNLTLARQWFDSVTNGGQIFRDALDYIVASGQSFWKYIKSLAPAFEPLLTAFSLIGQSVKRMWKIIDETFFDTSKTIGSTKSTWVPMLTATIGAIVSIVSAGLLLIVNLVERFVKDVAAFWKRYGNEITLANRIFTESIRGFFTILLSTVQMVINAIINLINGNYRGALNNVTTWLQTAGQTLYNTLRNMLSAMLTYLNSEFPRFEKSFKSVWNFARIGVDLVSGFIQGVKDQTWNAIKQMTEFGKAIINALKNTLGIKSPSKAMLSIGINTAEGFKLGIEHVYPRIEQLMKDVSSTVQQVPRQFISSGQSINQITYNNSYNLGVNTRASANEVTQSFAIMKALSQ